MFKSKGVMVGLSVAVVATALLAAGTFLTSTTGAATDNFGAPDPFPTATAPSAPIANPPASPVEPPAANPDTGIDPTGAPAAGSSGPGALPSAGTGDVAGGTSTMLLLLIGLAGVALIGAGGAAVASTRKN
jgi:hypothetical protein